MVVGISGLRQWFRRARAYRGFLKGASVGKGFVCGARSHCTNPSGDRSRIRIGDHVEVLGRLKIQGEGKIVIGDHVAVREKSRVDAAESIEIGSFVIISTSVRITDNNHHPTSAPSRRAMLRSGHSGPLWDWTNPDVSHEPVRIEDDVWICEGALILKGVTIGRGAIVAARAVVTHDVPAHTLVAGNPAQIAKYLES